jgi:hypothetical protein
MCGLSKKLKTIEQPGSQHQHAAKACIMLGPCQVSIYSEAKKLTKGKYVLRFPARFIYGCGFQLFLKTASPVYETTNPSRA